jgi:DNA-binding PadR family transcriptional regulator
VYFVEIAALERGQAPEIAAAGEECDHAAHNRQKIAYSQEVSLRHAVLAVLLDGPASGYDLAKRFDRPIANFWHATRQQIYAELTRLESEGAVEAELVTQKRRPDKRLFRVTELGRRAVSDWIGQPARPTSIKDEMLLRVQAAGAADAPALLVSLGRWREERAARLARYRQLQDAMLAGRGEAR